MREVPPSDRPNRQNILTKGVVMRSLLPRVLLHPGGNGCLDLSRLLNDETAIEGTDIVGFNLALQSLHQIPGGVVGSKALRQWVNLPAHFWCLTDDERFAAEKRW